MVKDRWIGFLRLGVEVRGCFSKKRPWSADPKKGQNCLEIGPQLSEGQWSGIIFSRKCFIFGFYTFYNISHTGEIMLNMQLRELLMNVYKSC